MKGVLSCLLALVLVFSITPSVFAGEPVGVKTIYVDAIKGDDEQEGVGTTAAKAYRSIGKAVKAAKSGDTIKLAEGNYSLYDVCGKKGTDNTEYTKNKDLTFIGAGSEETKWGIGPEVPDPKYYNTEYNGDYCFDGAGTITFQNMTLQSESVDYLGFIRADNTVVDACVVNGMTTYWGYKSAVFKNTTFNCPNNYAIHAYSSHNMLIEKCIFEDAKGKAVKIYNEGGTSINLTFKDNTVISKKEKYAVINIDDRFTNFTVDIIGHNSISGPAKVDTGTCSRLFGFSNGSCNTGKTIVKFGDTTVWQNGEMDNAKAYHNSGVTANGVTYTNNVEGSNKSLYAEGYKDNAFDTTYGEWSANENGKISRTVTKTCKYCGYDEEVTESQGKLTYDANGGKGEPVSVPGAAEGSVTVAKNVFTRSNYTFTGWNTPADGKGTAYKPGDTFTLTGNNTVLYAQWSKNSGSAGTGTSETAKPTDSPKTGDNSSLALWFALLLANGGAVTATTIYGRKNKRSVK